MTISPQTVRSEILKFCDLCSKGLADLHDDRARVDFAREKLPELLLARDLFTELLRQVVDGSGYPDIRRPTLFDNELLLHVDSERRFSLRMYLWDPGEHTHPHDHNSWGVIGPVTAGYEVTNFRRMDDGSREGYAQLEPVETLLLDAGKTAFTLPFDEGIHRTGNPTGTGMVTLHLYGKSLPRGYLNRFDLNSNRVYRILPPRTRKRLLAEQALKGLQ
jgi:predicted metal-dependent enzyme (double-stranded beta helix superfamily)